MLNECTQLDSYIEKRNNNYQLFIDLISKYSDRFRVPIIHSGCSNFCFPIICKEKEYVDKLKILFDDNGIEYRPIIGGNLLRQPFLSNYSITTNKEQLIVDKVHENGIYLGNNQFVGRKEIDILESIFIKL